MKFKTMKKDEFMESLKEAQKDPEFRQDIRKFIKATTSVYKL